MRIFIQLRKVLKFLFNHFRPTPILRFSSLARRGRRGLPDPFRTDTKSPRIEKTQEFNELFSKFAGVIYAFMKKSVAYISVMMVAAGLCLAWGEACRAQSRAKRSAVQAQAAGARQVQMQTGTKAGRPDGREGEQMLQYIVEGKDTIYIDHIRASKVYSKLPKQKGREWRKYYRLVHNFSKSYPYALVAKKLVLQADSTIAADNLKRGKREKYVTKVQNELFEVFEGQMRSLTVSQGALLMKLIDREVGKSSYLIIKDYKNGMAAGFWQGIAKMFGTDLKKPYDPEGEDRAVEELVEIWEAGDFPAFYWSLFWKDPPEMPIPEKYL